MIIAGSEGGENGGEGVNHGAIVLGGHGADKDGVEVINVGHKNILHRPEGADGEGTRKIGVHGAGGEVGEGCDGPKPQLPGAVGKHGPPLPKGMLKMGV